MQRLLFFSKVTTTYLPREQLDSVIYQTLPKPAEVIPDQQDNWTSYPNADVLLNSGHLNVTVTPQNVQVDFMRSVLAGQPESQSTGLVYSYTIDDSGNLSVLKTTDDSEAIKVYAGYQKTGDKPAKPDKNVALSVIDYVDIEELYYKPILGRPTDTSISISTCFPLNMEFFYSCGANTASLNYSTETIYSTNTANIIEITNLNPNTNYFYRLHCKTENTSMVTMMVFFFHHQVT